MVQPLLSHTIYIAIGIIAVMLIVAAFYGLKSDILELDARAKLSYTSRVIENKILEFKTLGLNAEANITIEGDGKVYLSNNLLKIVKDDVEISREISAAMQGEQTLPGTLFYGSSTVIIG